MVSKTERKWSGNGVEMDGRADPNAIRADIKTEAEERGKVRYLEEKMKKNANFREKDLEKSIFFCNFAGE